MTYRGSAPRSYGENGTSSSTTRTSWVYLSTLNLILISGPLALSIIGAMQKRQGLASLIRLE